ncbi:DUF4783 domain-containing protein [Cryomorpha ignava]|uniref:DUF4783 domain-containing protein n=1 Tax=Cryomorpha ignava TaxID=101383 RepID=A0A7K3WQZ8_9FLAO|nr:DUF4783 domain-containing protein [Cryomorpha ignava]NEN24100.1 DUF4783 domain-containing protein [Cryomorpha ignava]
MKKFFILVVFSLVTLFSYSQVSEKQGITKAIQEGNAKALGGYFTKTVDLTVKDVEDVYSKEQAEVILTRFFDENKTKTYTVKHEGKSKLDDYYYIGDLVTSTGTYRLTFFLKKDGEVFRVKQLRIENGE